MTLPNIPTELSEEQLEQLAEARKAIPQLREQIRRAKLAGIELSDQESELAALEQQIEKLQRVYGRPTRNA